jgi:hypothetical protein
MKCPHCHLAIDREFVLAELKRDEVAALSRESLIERIERWQSQHRRTRSGSVLQAKDGTWYGFASLGCRPDGRRLRRKVTAHSQEEAEERLTAVLKAAGIAPPAQARPLSNRSHAQLRRLYQDILNDQTGPQ